MDSFLIFPMTTAVKKHQETTGEKDWKPYAFN